MAAAVEARTIDLARIPLRGLSGPDPLSFPLYHETGPGCFVLYQPSQREFDYRHEDRLSAEGVEFLYIRESDRQSYSRRIERALDAVLKDRNLSVENRAAILAGVAAAVTSDIFAAVPQEEEVQRARSVMAGAASMVVRDEGAFAAMRRVLTASPDLADHSRSVGILTIGLALRVLGNDPGLLMNAGLAGLLHDVGRIGRDPDEPDHEHTARGYHVLRGLQLPPEICDAAQFHHERFDGSGFPAGLQGEQIPRMARVVGIVNTFHRVYGESEDEGVFHALRIMAQVYRGCFDPGAARAFVQMFGYQ